MTHPARSLRTHLGLAQPTPDLPVRRTGTARGDGFVRHDLEYEGLEGDTIPAFLFVPDAPQGAGVVVFHQHGGQFDLGKSEVAGEAGAPLQAFAPELARRGVVVLAPDAISFEDRRERSHSGDPADADWLQHYNAMAYRLLDGDALMRKALDDAQRAVSVLLARPEVEAARVGVCGHSYGGSTALYLAALDLRCRFACISGALASLAERRRRGIGINVFEVVPGLATLLEVDDLLRAITPRPTFIVSGTEDPYAADADAIVGRVASDAVRSLRVQGKHELDPERFQAIVDWVVETSGAR